MNRNRHILLDTIAGSTKNMSHIVVFRRLKSFRSNGKKEWMLFSLVYIPPVHDEWTDFIIPPSGTVGSEGETANYLTRKKAPINK
jgi:hypothetical protein